MKQREPTASRKFSDAPEFNFLDQNIQAVISLYEQAESRLTHPQRMIEKSTIWLSRPSFIYLSLLFMLTWIIGNFLAPRVGLPSIDSPPFPILQDSLAIGSFLVTLMILSAESRQSKVQERQGQLDLQMNLLAEQKITKIIALIEELRRDLPIVTDRHDPEALLMQEATDPIAVLNALEEKLEVANDS